jgi:DNA mismatch endonuclease (patch repair protein)
MSRWPGNAEREQTTFGGLLRGELMSRVRSTGNRTTEIRLASLLRRSGLDGWRRHQVLAGYRIDFVWRKFKVAAFVDGCFWHGHDCGKNGTPKTNADAWREKIRRNRERDTESTRRLRQHGWKVTRIWECELAKNAGKSLSRIRRVIERETARRVLIRRR